MSSSSIKVTPALLTANRKAAVADYKILRSNHASLKNALSELAKQEDRYKKQMTQLKKDISSPIETSPAEQTAEQIAILQELREMNAEIDCLLETVTASQNTIAHLKRGMTEMESTATQLEQILNEEKQDHKQTKAMLRKEESALDALKNELELVRKKLDAGTEYGNLANENKILITERDIALRELEKQSARYEKLQLDSTKNVQEVLDKTNELCVVREQIEELQKQLGEKPASPENEGTTIHRHRNDDAGLISRGLETPLDAPAAVIPPDTDAKSRKKDRKRTRKVKHMETNEWRLFRDGANDPPVVKLPSSECYRPWVDYTNDKLDQEPLPVLNQTVPEFDMSEDGANDPPVVNLPASKCYRPWVHYTNDKLDEEPLPANMSVACVKQLCPDPDTASNVKLVDEVVVPESPKRIVLVPESAHELKSQANVEAVVPESTHELKSQANVLDAVSEDKGAIPAAVEQTQNQNHTQASVYEAEVGYDEFNDFHGDDEADYDGDSDFYADADDFFGVDDLDDLDEVENIDFNFDAGAFFDPTKAEPALNVNAAVFVPAFVPIPKKTAQDTEMIAEGQHEASKPLVQQDPKQTTESSKPTEKPTELLEKMTVDAAPTNRTDGPITKSATTPDPPASSSKSQNVPNQSTKEPSTPVSSQKPTVDVSESKQTGKHAMTSFPPLPSGKPATGMAASKYADVPATGMGASKYADRPANGLGASKYADGPAKSAIKTPKSSTPVPSPQKAPSVTDGDKSARKPTSPGPEDESASKKSAKKPRGRRH